jgi:hypothetical protein
MNNLRVYKGNTRPRSRDIGRVLVWKELAETLFFKRDSSIEKAPGNASKKDSVQKISEYELRTDGPVVKAHVRGMSKDAVNAVRDQNVRVFFGQLDHVIKGLGCRRHGERPKRLGDCHDYQPDKSSY